MLIYLLSDIHAKSPFEGLVEYIEKATDEDLLIVLGDDRNYRSASKREHLYH